MCHTPPRPDTMYIQSSPCIRAKRRYMRYAAYVQGSTRVDCLLGVGVRTGAAVLVLCVYVQCVLLLCTYVPVFGGSVQLGGKCCVYVCTYRAYVQELHGAGAGGRGVRTPVPIRTRFRTLVPQFPTATSRFQELGKHNNIPSAQHLQKIYT